MIYSKKPASLLTKAVILPTMRIATQGLLQGKSILDVACSIGETTRHLVRWGAYFTYGFDVNEELIKTARKRNGYVKAMRFGVEDMLEYKEPNTYDLVTAVHAYNYLDSREKVAVALRNAHESLKDDGVLIGMVPNGIQGLNPREKNAIRLGAGLQTPSEPWRDGLATKMNFYVEERLVNSADVYFYFQDTYAQLLKEAGFAHVEWMNPVISSEYLVRYGDDFFHHYLTPPKDIVFRAFAKWQK